jgi:hypothetical protein
MIILPYTRVDVGWHLKGPAARLKGMCQLLAEELG